MKQNNILEGILKSGQIILLLPQNPTNKTVQTLTFVENMNNQNNQNRKSEF